MHNPAGKSPYHFLCQHLLHELGRLCSSHKAQGSVLGSLGLLLRHLQPIRTKLGIKRQAATSRSQHWIQQQRAFKTSHKEDSSEALSNWMSN